MQVSKNFFDHDYIDKLGSEALYIAFLSKRVDPDATLMAAKDFHRLLHDLYPDHLRAFLERDANLELKPGEYNERSFAEFVHMQLVCLNCGHDSDEYGEMIVQDLLSNT